MSELMVVDPKANMALATGVAEVCKKIIDKTAKSFGRGDKRHILIDGWRAIAATHGCLLSIEKVVHEPGSEHSPAGVSAIAAVIRQSDGAVLVRAEGFVGDDEERWASQPEHAKRSMAQTRAQSKAAQAAFAHVVVLIGDPSLSTTPYEEMDGVRTERERPAQARRAPQQQPSVNAQGEKDLAALSARLKKATNIDQITTIANEWDTYRETSAMPDAIYDRGMAAIDSREKEIGKSGIIDAETGEIK